MPQQHAPLRPLQRGESGPDVAALRRFLSQYGYLRLPSVGLGVAEADVSISAPYDNRVAAAVAQYQRMQALEVTGELDEPTMRRMQRPRCGVANRFGIGFSLAVSTDRWEVSPLRYRFVNGCPGHAESDVEVEMASACAVWSAVSGLTFVHAPNAAEIRVQWLSQHHGGPPDLPFDGPGRNLGHAWGPGHPFEGELHLDADEEWRLDGSGAGTADLQTQLIHELGHVLGLVHSSDPSSVMFESFEAGEVKRTLSPGDVAAIRALYET
jgi:hypothetical protein